MRVWSLVTVDAMAGEDTLQRPVAFTLPIGWRIRLSPAAVTTHPAGRRTTRPVSGWPPRSNRAVNGSV